MGEQGQSEGNFGFHRAMHVDEGVSGLKAGLCPIQHAAAIAGTAWPRHMSLSMKVGRAIAVLACLHLDGECTKINVRL